jgi:hypothetical protein
MTWKINKKEIESVLKLAGAKRYLYFIKKIADQEEVWSLWTEGGWALARDDQGHELIPVWPHKDYACACADGEWAEYEPRMIPLSVWLERWTEGAIRDQRSIVIFPTPLDKGVVATPESLKDDLKKEISLYE